MIRDVKIAKYFDVKPIRKKLNDCLNDCKNYEELDLFKQLCKDIQRKIVEYEKALQSVRFHNKNTEIRVKFQKRYNHLLKLHHEKYWQIIEIVAKPFKKTMMKPEITVKTDEFGLVTEPSYYIHENFGDIIMNDEKWKDFLEQYNLPGENNGN
jgi:hypothetical protein